MTYRVGKILRWTAPRSPQTSKRIDQAASWPLETANWIRSNCCFRDTESLPHCQMAISAHLTVRHCRPVVVTHQNVLTVLTVLTLLTVLTRKYPRDDELLRATTWVGAGAFSWILPPWPRADGVGSLSYREIQWNRSSGIEIPSGWKLGSEFLEEFPEFVIEKHKFQGQMASTLSMPSTSSTMSTLSTLSTRDMKLQ